MKIYIIEFKASQKEKT